MTFVGVHETDQQEGRQGKEADEEASVVQENRVVAGVIEAIHGVTDKSVAEKNYLRARLNMG